MLKKAILICIKFPFDEILDIKNSMEELEDLSRTIEVEVLDRIIQSRKEPDPRYFMGYGKLNEIKQLFSSFKDGEIYLIFNNEISPIQARNIENETNFKVMTRTEIILEIFSLHARTQVSRMQVELARLEYKLTRIIGKGKELSRLGGGIGTRGPGEQKLELERREIRKRIKMLRDKLKVIDQEKDTQRKKRIKNTFKIAIAGYTNAGKSSLLKKLTKANVLIEDKLFATLDTTTRKLWLGDGIEKDIVITDTVGFIKDIPHELIESFKSTLLDTINADLIIELIDISDKNFENKINVVDNTLDEIGVNSNIILCFNKVDMLTEDEIKLVRNKYKNAIYISVKTGEGIDELKNFLKQYISTLSSRTSTTKTATSSL
ncbi:MAG: GTPase HflX [Brevinematales bacterium]|nr:GTPase HflX [Brevinematales bacterium]